MKIKPIKNPYIPKDYNGSMDYNCCKTDDESNFKYFFTKYTEVKKKDFNQIRFDITGKYTPQGGCVSIDKKYIFRAMVEADDLPAIIQKINIETGEIVKEIRFVVGHANDMFIENDILYILHSSSTNTLYSFTTNLDYIGTTSTGPTRWGQAFANNGLYVIGTVGSAYFSIYKGNTFLFRIKPDNAFSGLVRQGIFADENYIAVVLDNSYGAVIENEKGSRIMFYTWNGMFIKSVFVPVAEIEWADYKDGTLYFGTYEGRDPADVKSGYIYTVPFDLYPEQTVLTGRPTDVSGGMNNLQRLPEGTPVKLWEGNQMDGELELLTKGTGLVMDENGPFRYLKFKFDGANAQVFDWFPTNGGTVALREVDVTAANEDSTIRVRETRLLFDDKNQKFTVESCIIEEIKLDASENKITITKNPASVDCNKIRLIYGII